LRVHMYRKVAAALRLITQAIRFDTHETD
jgi:hypothetical protein